MTTLTNTLERIEETFRKEFDELGLKPPKGSISGLERELIIDYWRKAITQAVLEAYREVEVSEVKTKLDIDPSGNYGQKTEVSSYNLALSTISAKKEAYLQGIKKS